MVPILSPLPPLYAAWMDELFGGAIPQETKATCHDCAMCPGHGESLRDPNAFLNPSVKCCTYLPVIPNFIAGQILADDDPGAAHGRRTVESRIKAGLAVTPLGLGRAPRYAILYDNMSTQAFGRAVSMRCPHYQDEGGGTCSIWKHRNSVCSTYFCKIVRGAVGRNFWDATRNLLGTIERRLAQWCILELELSEETLEILFSLERPADEGKPLTAGALDGDADPEFQRRVWNSWLGRELEFYRECGRLVSSLTWQDVIAACGPDVQARARLAHAAYQQLLSDDLPERLQVGSYTVVESGVGYLRVAADSRTPDILHLTPPVARLLPYFDGRTIEEVRQQIASEEHIQISDGLLRRLVDFRILVAGGDVIRDTQH